MSCELSPELSALVLEKGSPHDSPAERTARLRRNTDRVWATATPDDWRNALDAYLKKYEV